MSGDSGKSDRVLVTGFGPFGVHKVNSSWIAVQELEKIGLDDPNVQLVTEEIQVNYDHVKAKVPELWSIHSPLVVVHVGVSGMSNAVTLEKCGHNDGYMRLDVDGKCPDSGCCLENGVPDHLVCIETALDLEKVCQRFSEKTIDVEIEISENAGRYLCEFIYYSSLSIDNTRSLFVHVPDLTTYSAEKLGRALKLIVDELVAQIRRKKGS